MAIRKDGSFTPEHPTTRRGRYYHTCPSPTDLYYDLHSYLNTFLTVREPPFILLDTVGGQRRIRRNLGPALGGAMLRCKRDKHVTDYINKNINERPTPLLGPYSIIHNI